MVGRMDPNNLEFHPRNLLLEEEMAEVTMGTKRRKLSEEELVSWRRLYNLSCDFAGGTLNFGDDRQGTQCFLARLL